MGVMVGVSVMVGVRVAVFVGVTGVGVSVMVGVGVLVENQPGVPARLPVAHRTMSAKPATIKSPARTPTNALPDFCFLL